MPTESQRVVDLPLGEVGAVNPNDSVGRLAKAWRLLAVAVVAGGGGALLLSLLIGNRYESEVDFQVGFVHGQVIENPRVLAAHLQSEGFRRATEIELSRTLPRNTVATEVISGPEPNSTAYIRILTRGQSPEAAAELARHIAKFVEARHAPIYESVAKGLEGYRQQLESNLKRLDADVAVVQARLGEPVGTGNPVAGLLLQSQLSEARTQQIELRKQLRDAQIAEALTTRPTRALGPPTELPNPTWPNRPLFFILGAGLGLMLTGVLVLLRS